MNFRRLFLVVAMVGSLCLVPVVHSEEIGYGDLAMSADVPADTLNNDSTVDSDIKLIRELQAQVASLQSQLIELARINGSCVSPADDLKERLNKRLIANLKYYNNIGSASTVDEPVFAIPYKLGLFSKTYHLSATITTHWEKLAKVNAIENGQQLYTDHGWIKTKTKKYEKQPRIHTYIVSIKITKSEFEALGGGK